MEINVVKVRKDAAQTIHDNTSPLTNRIGFWGTVDSVDSSKNRVNVCSDTGIMCEGLPVYSAEWVNADKDKDYVTGSRNLPPVGARVFVLMPTYTITGAFVLCSGYAIGESKTKTLLAENSSETKKFNTIKESVSQGGWDIKEDYSTGNKSFISKDEKIKVELNVEDNNQEKQSKGLIITAWDHVVTISDSEIKIESNKDVTLDATNNNVTVVAKKFSVKPSKNSDIADLEVT